MFYFFSLFYSAAEDLKYLSWFHSINSSVNDTPSPRGPVSAGHRVVKKVNVKS